LDEYYNKDVYSEEKKDETEMFKIPFRFSIKNLDVEKDIFENRQEKNYVSSLNNNDFSFKKINFIETNSNSHYINNSLGKSQINFNFDNGFIKNSFIYNSGIIKNIISNHILKFIAYF